MPRSRWNGTIVCNLRSRSFQRGANADTAPYLAAFIGADGALYQFEDSAFSFLPVFGSTSAASRYTCKGL